MTLPGWLPPLLTLESCGGDWHRYVEEVYARFQRDYIFSRPTFRGVPVKYRRDPVIQGKEATFWHLVSEGKLEEDRTPDLRRSERISWPRNIIENADSPEIKAWENQRQGMTNVCLWLYEHDYIVILGLRPGYTLLLTAYTIREFRRAKFQREYEEYSAAQKN